MKPEWLTKAYNVNNQKIAIMQVGTEFKIMKKCINYVRGKNIESWRVMGTASTFDNLKDCLDKFSKIVNKSRKNEGKATINFIAE